MTSLSFVGWWDRSSLCGAPGLTHLPQPSLPGSRKSGALRTPRNIPGLGWPAPEAWACQGLCRPRCWED